VLLVTVAETVLLVGMVVVLAHALAHALRAIYPKKEKAAAALDVVLTLTEELEMQSIEGPSQESLQL
jgi:hypothetical protein